MSRTKADFEGDYLFNYGDLRIPVISKNLSIQRAFLLYILVSFPLTFVVWMADPSNAAIHSPLTILSSIWVILAGLALLTWEITYVQHLSTVYQELEREEP